MSKVIKVRVRGRGPGWVPGSEADMENDTKRAAVRRMLERRTVLPTGVRVRAQLRLESPGQTFDKTDHELEELGYTVNVLPPGQARVETNRKERPVEPGENLFQSLGRGSVAVRALLDQDVNVQGRRG